MQTAFQTTYDVIVLGAGAMGSAAAYYAARRGLRVLLLEQFEIDHQWGSSWGQGRIIRYSYADPEYIQLARETYPLWRELEAEAGEELWIVTGGIDFGHLEDERLTSTIRAVQGAGLSHELLTPDEANRRFPHFRFSDAMTVLYQPDSGLIMPSRCVRAHVHLAQRHGATVQDRTPVTSLDIHGDSVTVHTADGAYSAARLIVTAGSWAARLLSEQTGLSLPLQPLRCQEALFTADDPLYHAPNMPVFIYHRQLRAQGLFAAYDPEDDASMYGLPSHDGSGVKAAFHAGRPFAHPSEIDYEPDAEAVVRIRAEIGGVLPLVRTARLALTRICLYTMTPDEHFIIDHHPAHPQIVIGAGFSGHGFKFSTGIGKILSELALDGSTPHDTRLFRLARVM